MNRQESSPTIDADQPDQEAIPRGISLVEYFEQEHDDSQTSRFLEQMVKENPFLSDVEVIFISADKEPNTGGVFDIRKVDETTYTPTIFIVENDAQHTAKILQDRKSSNEIVASLLGMEFEKLTPELLRLFIIAHELGHATDYIKNYESNPSYANVAEASEEWDMHYEVNLSSLPVPHFDPAQLTEKIAGYSNIKEFVIDYPEAKSYVQSEEITTLEQLLHDQEVAYRNSPYEKYADNFAAKFLKKNAQEIGIPELTH